MNPLLRTALKEAVSDGGTIDPIEDFDAIKRLEALADRVIGTERTKAYIASLRPSVQAGNATLRPLTIGASEFLTENVERWFDGDDRESNLALAFVLAHGDRPEEIWKHGDNRQSFVQAMKRWKRSINATEQEIAQAMLDLRVVQEVNQTEEKATEERSRNPETDNGWLVELLVAAYGQTPHYWLWEASIDHIEMLVRHRAERMEAEARQMSRAKGMASAPDPDSSYIRALYEFRLKCAEFAAKTKARTQKRSTT